VITLFVLECCPRTHARLRIHSPLVVKSRQICYGGKTRPVVFILACRLGSGDLVEQRELIARAPKQISIASPGVYWPSGPLQGRPRAIAQFLQKPTAADSDDVGRAFQLDVGHLFRSKSAGRSDGCRPGWRVAHWSGLISPSTDGAGQARLCGAVFLRSDSPRSWRRWALCTTRSRMASASVGSPMMSCQRSTGSWLVISVAPRP
jgi:hypothetical protein